MKIEFDYVVADLKQAVLAHAEAVRIANRRSRWGLHARWLLVVSTLVGTTQFMYVNLNAPWAGRTLYVIGTVGMVIGGLMIGLSFMREAQTRPVEQFVTPPSAAHHWIGWLLFAGVPFALFVVQMMFDTPWDASSLPVLPGRPAWLPLFHLLFPWVLIFAYIALRILRALTRTTAAKVWKRTAAFQLHHRVEADDANFIIDDGRKRSEIRWHAFERFVETPEHFLIYGSAHGFTIIPKRSFGSPAGADEFRELLRRNVRGKAQGFAVATASVA